MANDEDLARIQQGTAVWNDWRAQNHERRVDLSQADLTGTDLTGANLSHVDLSEACLRRAVGANLSFANLVMADLIEANLRGADLRRAQLFGANLTKAELQKASLVKAEVSAELVSAKLHRADLRRADLSNANLRDANLYRANLTGTNLNFAKLVGANLAGADLTNATLVQTDLTGARLRCCRVYGICAWDLKLDGAIQRDLEITRFTRVDDVEVAQFINLLLNNKKIRDVIDTIGKKGVLLLGRFSGKLKDKSSRMALLERSREELRKRDFVPIVFNFGKPEKSDFTETIMTLAGLCRFIIADITNPRSTPLELQATVPAYMIPFVPIIEVGEEPFAMFQDLQVKYSEWVLDTISYGSVEELVQGLDEYIIEPALVRFDELLVKKTEKRPIRRIGTAATPAALFP